MELLYIFLPMILFLGFVTSYEDIKFGKIRNKWIVISLAYVVLAYIIISIYFYYFSPQAIRPEYYLELISTFVVSLVIGFIMWVLGFWNAGDAKLYSAFSFLIPLTVYNYGHVKYFASSAIFINTVVPFFFVYSLIFMYKTSQKQKFYYLKKSLQPKELFMLFLFFFAMIWPTRLFFDFTHIQSNFFILLFFMFILFVLLEKVNGLLISLLVASILRIIFDPKVFMFSSWRLVLYSLAGFVFLRFFILYIAYDFMTVNVDVCNLKKGMIPAEVVYHDKKYKKEKLLHFSFLSYMTSKLREKNFIYKARPEGFSEKDIKKLKSLEKNLGFEHIRIYKTLSFAPYMFAGVLLTILFKGNLFISFVIFLK